MDLPLGLPKGNSALSYLLGPWLGQEISGHVSYPAEVLKKGLGQGNQQKELARSRAFLKIR